MNFWKKSLNRQILAITLVTVMGASVIISIIALVVFYRYSQNQALLRNQETARYISNEIEMLMDHALNLTEAIARDPGIAGFDPENVQYELHRAFDAANMFDGMSLINSSGRTVAFMPETSGIVGMDLSQGPYVQEVLRSGAPVVSEPLLAKTGNEIVVAASPVRDKKGQVTGLVAGSINLKKNPLFSRIVGNTVGDPAMMVQIVSKQGKIIYHPNRDMIMKDISRNSVVLDMLNGNSGARATDINGEPFLTAYSSVEKLGWGVLVDYPKYKALASAIYLRDLMILVTILMCLAVFFVTLFQSKAIARPVERLMEGVKRVAAGDYHFTVDVDAQNEIGVLADAFNSMVGRIKEMREDILRKKEELEKANIELKVMAMTDGLTKLYNHRYFQDCLENAVALAKQENKAVTLMILDIDHFKYYNDLFGHQAGDRLLEELAELLIRELGPNDMVARYGGEEFTVILYDCDSKHGLEVAEKIRSAVESFPFPGRHQQPDGKVTVSIGVASYPENAKNKEELFKLADEALYKAKSCSRNKVELYFSVLDDLKADMEQSEVELINSIKMLIRIINAKDKYTYGHSERVGKYAVWIAEKMGLPEDEIKIIKIGSFLHDVGKIEISRSILMKKGPMTKEDYEVMRKHPLWGAGIIKAVESLRPTLPLIKYHHEHFDGSGYPIGLKGKQIPLHARILAVADCFDAMTSNRPYSKRKSPAEAIEELKKCSGTQFDPEIVEAFLCVLREQKEKVG